MSKLFISNDQSITLTGLKETTTNQFVNTATVVAQIIDLTTNTQVGSDIAMPYVAATNGNYRGTIPDDLALVLDRLYRVDVTADGAGAQGEWSEEFRAKRRSFAG